QEAWAASSHPAPSPIRRSGVGAEVDRSLVAGLAALADPAEDDDVAHAATYSAPITGSTPQSAAAVRRAPG
ncbi:MAG: hypothetical protein HY703_08270, partial [Gemmatimonadetes bacterium]|nr:hypothetical protein [Gemmatimonadota bacterium]